MVREQLLVCASDIEMIVFEVEADLVWFNSESLCDEFDDELSNI